MAIDAGLERLRHAVLEEGADDDRLSFHPRGRGSGAGPVDYLLERPPARRRHRSAGKPEEVRELIDASPMQKIHLRRAVFFRTGLTASVKS